MQRSTTKTEPAARLNLSDEKLTALSSAAPARGKKFAGKSAFSVAHVASSQHFNKHMQIN
jgi:hypothetical protein